MRRFLTDIPNNGLTTPTLSTPKGVFFYAGGGHEKGDVHFVIFFMRGLNSGFNRFFSGILEIGVAVNSDKVQGSPFTLINPIFNRFMRMRNFKMAGGLIFGPGTAFSRYPDAACLN
jgi:hypothetical protein